MSASRFLLFTTLQLPTHKPFSTISSRFFTQPSPLSPLHLHFRLRLCRYSSFAAVDVDALNLTPSSHHPWPEWVSFVDKLKAKGYFKGENGSNDAKEGVNVYTDMNLVKDACLSFARDRYDVFKSLPIEDIQKVVEHGCPNLLRKAVNSAKRLRAYARLDEGDVCCGCDLRGSCDKAYVVLKESEAAARTVDMVRILLFYALDPLVISGGGKPAGKGIAEASAKKLFSELIKLSETAPAPSLPKPVPKSLSRKEEVVKHIDDELSQNVEMLRGDWMCPKCNFMNFSRNIKCLNCQEDGPKKVGGDEIEMKKGDWICPECNFMNFSRNIRCLKCKAEGPKRVAVDKVEMKKGDWNCRQCDFMNFASNKKCLRCSEPRPPRQLNTGEWECPSCDFLNYRRNKICLKCKCERPKEVATEYEENIWSPH